MKRGNSIVPRVIACLVGAAAILTTGITAFVYTGAEHREAVTTITRQFFVLIEKTSRVRPSPVNASASPTPAGGIIQ